MLADLGLQPDCATEPTAVTLPRFHNQTASGNIPGASQGNDRAECMLVRILGDEEEKQEVEAPEALAGTEAFAAAVEPP